MVKALQSFDKNLARRFYDIFFRPLFIIFLTCSLLKPIQAHVEIMPILNAAKNVTVDYVPDEETAISIAQAVLIPIYGKQNVEKQQPYHGRLEGDVWSVEGSLWCSPECLGGVAMVKINKKDGRILSVSHGE